MLETKAAWRQHTTIAASQVAVIILTDFHYMELNGPNSGEKYTRILKFITESANIV